MALLTRSAHPLHPPGGMERAVFELATHLQARGVDTVLLTRPATEAGSFPGRVVEVPYGAGGRHGSVLDRTLRYPAFAKRLAARRRASSGRARWTSWTRRAWPRSATGGSAARTPCCARRS